MRSRRKILDATLGVITDRGFGGVTIAAVAETAGVSRQTVYSIFSSREELVSQAISEVALAALDGLRDRLEDATNAVDYVVELIIGGRDAVQTSPILQSLLVSNTGNPLFDPGMLDRARVVAREVLSGIVELDTRLSDHLDDLSDYTLHLALSVVIFDDNRTDDELRTFLRRWIAPAVASVTESSS